MTMVKTKRVLICNLLLELKHGNGHNEESSYLLLTTGAKS
jgi:hypothetical protein